MVHLLVLSLAWGLWDEMYGIRPWKGYQAKFEKLYGKYLSTAKLGAAEVEKQIKASSEYKRLDAEMQAAEKAAMPEASAIDKEVNEEPGSKNPGAQRSLSGSAQPHRRADLPDRSHAQRKLQELAAQGDPGLEGRDSQSLAARRVRQAVDDLRPNGSAASGMEGEKGGAAAEARGCDEEGDGPARRPRQVPGGPHRRRERGDHRLRAAGALAASISTSGRFT